MATLSTFFAGRGNTVVVLSVNVLATIVNIVLDYLWIFGKAGFPRPGVAGAAWATVVSQVVGAGVYLWLILRPRFREEYGTLSGWRFESALFRRLLRYGLPSGSAVLAGGGGLRALHDDRRSASARKRWPRAGSPSA